MLGTSTDKKFQVSLGYRESYADRLFKNARVDRPLTRALSPKQWLNSLDVTATYNMSRRFSLTGSLPIVLNNISFLIPPTTGGRQGLEGAGIGDLSFLARGMLLDPEKHPRSNVAIGMGIKIPTGNPGPKEVYPDVQGVFARKAVTPNSIPPGDGGTAGIFEAVAYKTFHGKHLFRGSNILLTANYLMNPRNTNRTPSVIASLGLAGPQEFNALTNSVCDSYSVRATYSAALPGMKSTNKILNRLRFQAFYRWEGIPERDLIGGSKGFRQPGYVMAVGPGVSVRLWRQTRFNVEVPITINGRIDPNPYIPNGGPLRQFGFISPVGVVTRLTSSF